MDVQLGISGDSAGKNPLEEEWETHKALHKSPNVFFKLGFFGENLVKSCQHQMLGLNAV